MTEERMEEGQVDIVPVGSEEAAKTATDLIQKTAEFLGAVECAAVELVVDAADSYVTHDLAEKVLNNVVECLEEVDWDDRVGDHARSVDLTDMVSEKVDEELGDVCWDDRVGENADEAITSRIENFDYDEKVGEAIGEVDIRDVLTAHIDATLDCEGLSSIGMEEPFQLAIKGLLGEGVVDNFEEKFQDLVDTSVLAYNDCEKLVCAVGILERRLAEVENRGVRGWCRRVKAARQERRAEKALACLKPFASPGDVMDTVAATEAAMGLRVHQPENGS